MTDLQTIRTMDRKGKISMDKIWEVHMSGKKYGDGDMHLV